MMLLLAVYLGGLLVYAGILCRNWRYLHRHPVGAWTYAVYDALFIFGWPYYFVLWCTPRRSS